MKLAERIFRRKDHYITSPFGTRTDPISGVKKTHNGCDYGTNVQNWEQYALEDGEVIAIQTGIKDKDKNGGYGNYVKVKYPRLGIQLLHAHLKEVRVKKGSKVNKNTILGTTGTTGYSTGIHLHLGLQKIGNTTWLDPEKYDYVEEKKETTSIFMKFAKGDKVILNGYLYKDSYGNGKGIKKTNYKGVITITNKNGAKPYHIDNLGWVAESDITKQSSITYTVKKGDTLGKIAKKYNTTWQKIYNDNKDIIGNDPNIIKPGQKLVIN